MATGTRARIHILSGDVEWYHVPGSGSVLLVDRPAGAFEAGDDLVISGRGTWPVADVIEAGPRACGLLVTDFPAARV